VLVEVRSRSCSEFGSAAATVSRAKQRRCWLAARHLLMMRPGLRRLRARFDVVAIDAPDPPDSTPSVTWIRNAFAPG
jgi:putative endonuclease